MSNESLRKKIFRIDVDTNAGLAEQDEEEAGSQVVKKKNMRFV